MIDTDKYEGHTEGPWCIDENEESDYDENPDGIHIYALRLREDVAPHPISAGVPIAQHTGHGANAQLIADAPKLLAEVKRLQSIISVFDEYMMNDFMTDFSRSKAHAIWNELVRGDGI